MKNKVKRTERGWAGHFICGNDCRFRRNTLLEYGDKKVVVSTVGNMPYFNPITKKGEVITIGLNRYYETMAFEAKLEDGLYWEADIIKPIDFESNWAIDEFNYITDQMANDMHEKVVEELMEKIQL